MLDNKPYQSELLNRVLHTRLQTMGGMLYSRDECALKSVALVGMLLPEQDRTRQGHVIEKDLFAKDLHMLERSFNDLSRAGIPLHPDATFQIYNILPPVQSDYLLAALGTPEIDFPSNDLTIIQYLPKKGVKPDHRFFDMSTGLKNCSTAEIESDENVMKPLGVSHLHQTFHIWAEAANNLGAKFVIIHGGTDNEITTEEFEGHPAYRTLVDSGRDQSALQESEIGHPTHGVDTRNTMGVLIHRNSVAAFKPVVDTESEIGQALHFEIT